MTFQTILKIVFLAATFSNSLDPGVGNVCLIYPELGIAQPQLVMHRTHQYAHYFYCLNAQLSPSLYSTGQTKRIISKNSIKTTNEKPALHSFDQ